MSETGAKIYCHLHWETEPHLYHANDMKRVKSTEILPELAGSIPSKILDSLYSTIDSELSDEQKKILQVLQVGRVPGLPIKKDKNTKYAKSNSFFVSDKEHATLQAVSYPLAQRGITRFEGWVSPDGNIYTEHNITGVGMTKSVDRDYYQRQMYPGRHSGLIVGSWGKIGTVNQIVGTTVARDAGILAPLVLPPLKYEQVIFNGKRMFAKTYTKNETAYNAHHIYAANTRIAALIRQKERIKLDDEDLELTMSELDISVAEARRRVSNYLLDCQDVHNFNEARGTDYRLGMSEKMNGNYSFDSYAQAFYVQMIESIGLMVEHSIYHLNPHIQNISIAGEFGDWDATLYKNEEGRYMNLFYNTSESQMSMGDQAATLYRLITQSYMAVSIVQGMIGPGRFTTYDQYYRDVVSQFPEGHWAKSISLTDMSCGIRGNISHNESVEGVEREKTQERFYQLADAVRTKYRGGI